VDSDLRDRIKEIAEIAGSLPESLQQSCFEILLKHYLNPEQAGTPMPVAAAKDDVHIEPVPVAPPAAVEPPAPAGQADVLQADLHVKTRRFMEKYAVTLGELNNLFYKEDGQIKPLYEDLKTTRLAESQIRLALLQSLQHALTSGDFETQIETVRNECRDRKCYDKANFAANFRNNASLFDQEYSKDTVTIKLSEDGRREVAQLVKELQ
jgi:hypothetical protein